MSSSASDEKPLRAEVWFYVKSFFGGHFVFLNVVAVDSKPLLAFTRTSGYSINC